MDGVLKKIKDLEDFSGGSLLEFGTSIYAPNLFADGISSAKEFKIDNIFEIDSNYQINLDDVHDPLYYANNIHLRGINETPINITIPHCNEEEPPTLPTGTIITVEQTISGGTITLIGGSGVTINGVTTTEWDSEGDKRTLFLEKIDTNTWSSEFVRVGNILRNVINNKGVIEDDYVHGEKGRVLYDDPERPLHKLVTQTLPGFMDPEDKIKLDSVFLCPLVKHVETPEIHRSMVYSETFKCVLYNEDPVLPEWDYNEENPFHTWEEYAEYWKCTTGGTETIIEE